MNAKEFLNDVCKEIKYKPARKHISEELENHIEDIKIENLCRGYSEYEAEEIAVEQMGNPKDIGKKLNKIHKPKLDIGTLIFMIIISIIGGNSVIALLIPTSFWGQGYAGLNNLITTEVMDIIDIFVVLFSVFIYFYDYRKICKHSKLLYILATTLNIIAYIRGFRANGNLIYGLWPFMAVSPAVFTIPLYIIAFAGFMKDINKESKINITIPNQKKINFNIIKIIFLSILSVITSLMINFVTGFLVAMVYLIISTIELLKRKQYKNTIIFIVVSTILFSLLSTIICIVPTRWNYFNNELTSAYWVGVDTKGERAIDFAREEVLKNAKLFGKADLEDEPIKNEYGFFYNMQRYFGINGNFAFLGILSEYGWVASIGFVALLLLFNIKLMISATKIKEIYGKMIIIGISSLYMIQTVCNIAVSLGIIGIAEFDLPFFISAGNASSLVNVICIALILSVYRRKDINFEEPKKSKISLAIENFFFEEC